MNIVDRGNGRPLVLVPGLQGRWEYLEPAVDALAAYFRVLTFSLCDERSAHASFDPARGYDSYGDQIAAALQQKGLREAIICGISLGGQIAAHFAAAHPGETAALVLVSTPPSRMRLRKRHQFYLRLPWVLGPFLLAESPWRLRPELVVAMPDAAVRRRFSLGAVKTFLRAPLSLSKMAARARLLTRTDLTADCQRISAPTLIVTGEPGLDYVVPVAQSSEYARLIPHARSVVIERSGHLGSVTRPDVFAALVRDFVASEAGIRWPDAAA
jgi:pimeloyl-ACP methyl ester carboxylesterase